MGRIRTVKPELFSHEDLYDAEVETGLPLRLSFIGLFTVADREGRFKWRPRTLKLDVLPHDQIDFSKVLDALSARGIVISYEVDGERYGFIPSFLKHQVINQREAQSTIPAPQEHARTGVHVHARADDGDEQYKYRGVNIAPALRETILARDGNACRRCGATDDMTIDHIFPQSIGGTHAPSNLRALCRPCNSARPVAGQALIDDLAKDGLTLDDMRRMCMHVQAHGEGKGREGNKEGKEKPSVGMNPDKVDSADKVVTDLATIEGVFEYWRKVMQSPKSLLDDKRKGVIRRALKAGYSPRDLCLAIKGCSLTPHNQGKNERGQAYLGIHVCLKDADQIDRFIANAKNPPVEQTAASKSQAVTDANKGLGGRLAALAAAKGMTGGGEPAEAPYAPPNDGMTVEME